MNNFTMNTYEMKRDIVNFSKKICKNSNKPETKFVTDMIYGISKSKDILLSSIANALNEKNKKINTIDRLSNNLNSDFSSSIDDNYCNLVMNSLGDNPVFLVDDSDVIKPKGSKFQDLGIVKDGSSEDKSFKKGYHITEIVGLTKSMKQPISIFSKIHSSTSKDFVSSNDITFEALNKVVSHLNERNIKGIFVNDRGYDNNKIFNYYFDNNQYFVIRAKENRNVYLNHKWYKITTIRDSRKGKIKLNLMFQGEQKECFVSLLKVQVTAKKKWINLILIYGLGEIPMMLFSNIPIKSRDDVIKIARYYMNRWRIEEYFKFKKQEYNFENFRIRSLLSINNLNKLLTYAIGLIALLSEKIKKNQFVHTIIHESKSLKNDVIMWFYQISRGIYEILKMAKTGIREWEKIRKVKIYDGQISLL